MTTEHDEIRDKVRNGYAEVATKGQTCCSSSACCGDGNAESHAQALGYTDSELQDLPDGANMGLSCGNPTAIASLKEGDVVLDLGSGGGFDVFIAARKVGASGRSIGVDMTPEMLTKARGNAAKFRENTGLDNVEFRLGEIEHLPVADASMDVVISNCVLNLSPNKAQVWREIGRVLKPGGRVCISDIALLQPLPEKLKQSIHALVGCVAGAVLVDETVEMAKAAGLCISEAEKETAFVDQMASSDDPLYAEIMKEMPEGTKPHELVTSLRLVAVKPQQKGCCC